MQQTVQPSQPSLISKRKQKERRFNEHLKKRVTVTANQIAWIEKERKKEIEPAQQDSLFDAVQIDSLQPYNRRFCLKSGRELEPLNNASLLAMLSICGETETIQYLKQFSANQVAPHWLNESPQNLRKLRLVFPSEFILVCIHRIMSTRNNAVHTLPSCCLLYTSDAADE